MLLCALPLFSGQVDAELFERMPKFQILQHKGEITIKSDNKQKGLFIYLFFLITRHFIESNNKKDYGFLISSCHHLGFCDA